MKNDVIFKKKVNPIYGVFCRIELSEKEDKTVLTISGSDVVARSAGQIQDSILAAIAAENRELGSGWSWALLRQFADVWDKWHLNDMRAYCIHQKESWDIRRTCFFDVYTMKSSVCGDSQRLDRQTKERLLNGETVKWSADEIFVENLPYRNYVPSEPELSAERERNPLWSPATIERFFKHENVSAKQPACQTHETEHPYGILSKPCPVCGYKYGSKWLYEPVPENVVEFLKNLPSIGG